MSSECNIHLEHYDETNGKVCAGCSLPLQGLGAAPTFWQHASQMNVKSMWRGSKLIKQLFHDLITCDEVFHKPKEHTVSEGRSEPTYALIFCTAPSLSKAAREFFWRSDDNTSVYLSLPGKHRHTRHSEYIL